MKIKITRPDGSIAEAEGTPEECAALLGAVSPPKADPISEELRKFLADLASRSAPAPIWVSPYVYPWWWYSVPQIVQPTYIPPTYPTWIGTTLTIDPNVPCTTGTGIFVGDPSSTIGSTSLLLSPTSDPALSFTFNDQGSFSTNLLTLSADA